MLSVDIFLWTVTGRQEAASVLALLQTALVVGGYVGARWLLGRGPTQAVPGADRVGVEQGRPR
jgi:hypothetical protein